MGHTVAPQQHNSRSVVCSLTRVCARVYLCYASADKLGSACMCVCVYVYLWCVWVCACMCLWACVCVLSVGPWSLSVYLNQPSPVLFAQDMPQEAKTTVRVCPCCEPLLIHPTAAFFHSAQTLCLSVFLYIHPMESVGPSPPRKHPSVEWSRGGLKCQQISDWQTSLPSPCFLYNPETLQPLPGSACQYNWPSIYQRGGDQPRCQLKQSQHKTQRLFTYDRKRQRKAGNPYI